jgi:hypothetical protein
MKSRGNVTNWYLLFLVAGDGEDEAYAAEHGDEGGSAV